MTEEEAKALKNAIAVLKQEAVRAKQKKEEAIVKVIMICAVIGIVTAILLTR